jgi:hypothetical protein
MLKKIITNPMYLVIASACLLELMVYTGFCFKQFRYISDEDKIRIAIEYVIKENRKTVAQYKERAVAYPFNTADEFFASKPISCGAFSGLKKDLDWLKKIRGDLSSYVLLEFMGVYKGSPRKVVAGIEITNCGNATWEW